MKEMSGLVKSLHGLRVLYSCRGLKKKEKDMRSEIRNRVD